MPFARYQRDAQVISAVLNKELPRIPDDFTSRSEDWKALWKICEDCWYFWPGVRPSMDGIVTRLKALHNERALEMKTEYPDLLKLQAEAALRRLEEARLNERLPKACKSCSQKHRKVCNMV